MCGLFSLYNMNVKCEKRSGVGFSFLFDKKAAFLLVFGTVHSLALVLSWLVSSCPGVFFPWGSKLQDCALGTV